VLRLKQTIATSSFNAF